MADPTVVVTLNANIQVKVTDNGYLGPGASVQEHINKAVHDASNWQFLVKQGGLEPTKVAAVVAVESVLIVPKEG